MTHPPDHSLWRGHGDKSLWHAHYAALRIAGQEVLDAQAAMMNAAAAGDDFPAERNRFNEAMKMLGRALDDAIDGDAA